MSFQAPKGTFDILPYGAPEAWRLSSRWQWIEGVIRTLAADYGYQEIRTPLYERTELFHRGVGDSSDIVTKEMFTFLDKGDRSITLRPEGTASVMRSLVEAGLAQEGKVHKLFYIGPMFRYERPQSGRYRQHHQFGVEAIGASTPEQDAEVIDLLYTFYERLGIKNLVVHLNTVGDAPSRAAFREALLSYLTPYFSSLSSDSKLRFEKNPLRILDSKDPEDKKIVANAPSILDHLTPAAKEHFDQVCALLEAIDIPYKVDDRIVRGLDYYQKTVFEVLTQDLGAQNTIGAGGRFDGLVSLLGGADLPAVGFATGLERVLQTCEAQKVPFPPSERLQLYFIPLGEEARKKAFALATQCRRAHLKTDIELQSKKMQTALQRASEKGALYAALLGSEELTKGTIQLKHLERREQVEVPLEELIPYLKRGLL